MATISKLVTRLSADVKPFVAAMRAAAQAVARFGKPDVRFVDLHGIRFDLVCYGEGGAVSMVYETDAVLSPEQAADVRRMIDSGHVGIENAHRSGK